LQQSANTMALMKWRPSSPDFRGFEDLNRMFDEFMPALRGDTSGFVPAVDVYEDKDNVYVETQIAGIEPENVEASIENNVLSIKGESEKKSEVDEENYYRKEIRRGKFYRSIPLPAEVKGEEAKAETEKGLLRVIIPKAPETKPQKIRIDTQKK